MSSKAFVLSWTAGRRDRNAFVIAEDAVSAKIQFTTFCVDVGVQVPDYVKVEELTDSDVRLGINDLSF